MIIIIIAVVVVFVGNDTYYWVYLSIDHPFQVYCKVRQLILLQSATEQTCSVSCLQLKPMTKRHVTNNARVGGAPLLSKFTHPRKFGNHVTVHRPTAVRPHHRKTNVYSHTFS